MKRIKHTIKVCGLFFTVSTVPVKMKQNRPCADRENIDTTFRMKNLRRRVKRESGGVCPVCGKRSEQMELHHVLPVARFPELWNDYRNVVALCRDCHREIHINPFANIAMMRAKAAELDIDLASKYDIDITKYEIFSCCLSSN